MADSLVLRLPRDPSQPAAWMAVDAAGRATVPPQSGALAQAAYLATGRRVVAVVPGTDVLLTLADLPPRANQAKLQQVVPYALEEQVADDIENLHFAIGRRPAGSGRTPVAVVARALLEDWLAVLRAAGLTPQAMYADSELVPENPGQAVALIDEDTVVVRAPGALPATLPAEALATALELALPPAAGGAEPAARGLILYATSTEWERHAAEVEPLRERFEGIKVQLLPDGPLPLLAQHWQRGEAINLLQGPYTPQTAAAPGWRAWRAAAVLFGCLIALHAAGRAAELLMLQRVERQLDAAIAATFRTAMPGEQNPTDARRRMEQRLLAVRGGNASGLLPALGALVQARGGVPDTRVQALSYREGALDLRIAAPSADALDGISQALRANGWRADLTSGSVSGSAYEGRIQIRPGGAG